MASCVTLLLYYNVDFIDFCLEYKHNNGITFSPDLELNMARNSGHAPAIYLSGFSYEKLFIPNKRKF
jgi:hypothetical protein